MGILTAGESLDPPWQHFQMGFDYPLVGDNSLWRPCKWFRTASASFAIGHLLLMKNILFMHRLLQVWLTGTMNKSQMSREDGVPGLDYSANADAYLKVLTYSNEHINSEV